jgi:hypothetical protein
MPAYKRCLPVRDTRLSVILACKRHLPVKDIRLPEILVYKRYLQANIADRQASLTGDIG